MQAAVFCACQLSEDNNFDLCTLSEKADRIIAMLAKQKHNLHTVTAATLSLTANPPTAMTSASLP